MDDICKIEQDKFEFNHLNNSKIESVNGLDYKKNINIFFLEDIKLDELFFNKRQLNTSVQKFRYLSENQLNNLIQTMKCCICLTILKDPVFCKYCGKCFCSECGSQSILKSNNKDCPLCKGYLGTKRNLKFHLLISNISKFLF